MHRREMTAKGYRSIGFALVGLRRARHIVSNCGIRVQGRVAHDLLQLRSYESELRDRPMRLQSHVWDPSNAAEGEVAPAIDLARHDHKFTGQLPKRVFEETRLTQSTNSGKAWNHMVDCEARNALQVILSGSEILLDNKGCHVSPSDQRAILERILASAHHLHCMIATLTKPDEEIGEILVEHVDAKESHPVGSKAL